MNSRIICLLWLLLCPITHAGVVTFNGALTNQVIDGFGVNANYRSWNNDELKPVLDALIDQGGMTLFRIIHDNTDWEAINANAGSNDLNWAYFAPIYQSADFTKMWDLTAYLNSRGIVNGVFFNFQGPGPEWMGGANLAAGLESEWAKMIGSLLVWARNTNGLQFRYVGPDNETDVTASEQGIGVTNAVQYLTCMDDLAQLLDNHGMSDVQFIAPDLGTTDTNFMQRLMLDPGFMAKLGIWGLHSYYNNGIRSTGIAAFITSSPYPDRRFWMTEFNAACAVCDYGQPGDYSWAYCELTAANLLDHLQNNASAGIVWEGYDSYYVIPNQSPTGNWSFWGLFAIDDTNAAVKTYTPRKNFYTVSQISKWVRPGAQRIAVTGSTGVFSPLLAFSHTARGQVTIVGINTSTNSAALTGSLASLPAVTNLELYYTSATTNLADGGSTPVNQGRFSTVIPADCVFTLTGFTSTGLFSGIPVAETNAGTTVDYYYTTITNPVARVQFEIQNPSTNLILISRCGSIPNFNSGLYDYISQNPGTNNQYILVLTNTSPVGVSPGEWFLGVVNQSGTPATYTILTTQSADSGQPIILNDVNVQGNSLCFSWNSLPGAYYVIQAKLSLSDANWTDISGTIMATDIVSSACETMGPYTLFRVCEGIALTRNSYSLPGGSRITYAPRSMIPKSLRLN